MRDGGGGWGGPTAAADDDVDSVLRMGSAKEKEAATECASMGGGGDGRAG